MSPDPGSARLPEQPAIPRQQPSSGRTILLVEDEDGVREFVRTVLLQAGYIVVAASDGDEALALFRPRPFRFDLVLTDVMMPNRTGPELAADIRAIAPNVRILFMSGFAGGIPSHPVSLPFGTKVLAKPFSLDSLLHAIDRAIDK
jgi:two-component system, cell cycle sensor histidine kinase and response regulator CckA